MTKARWAEITSLLVVVVGGGILALVGNYYQLPTGSVLSLIAGLIATLAVYLSIANVLIERRLEKLESGGPRTSELLEQQFWYERLISAMHNAKHRIVITDHSPLPATVSGIQAKKDTFDLIGKIIKRRRVQVRWIAAANNLEKLQWLNQRIAEYRSCDNCDIRLAPIDLSYYAPPQSIQIIDDTFAFVIDMKTGHHSVSGVELDLVTREPAVVQQLQRYYDEYWQRCTKIKEGRIVYDKVLTELTNRLSQSIEVAEPIE